MKRMRLDRDARRRAILEAVAAVFAEKGFHGVRTRELAAAAGVSEALLYRHFPSKEHLYTALLEQVRAADDRQNDTATFANMPPSTAKLVWGIQRLAAHFSERTGRRNRVLPRLMVHSLLDDGAFARSMLGNFQRGLITGLGEALAAARDAGDAIDTGAADDQLWLVHHLLFGLRLLSMPRKDVISYGSPRAVLVDVVTRFVLRGLGVREHVIERELAALAPAAG